MVVFTNLWYREYDASYVRRDLFSCQGLTALTGVKWIISTRYHHGDQIFAHPHLSRLDVLVRRGKRTFLVSINGNK